MKLYELNLQKNETEEFLLRPERGVEVGEFDAVVKGLRESTQVSMCSSR